MALNDFLDRHTGVFRHIANMRPRFATVDDVQFDDAPGEDFTLPRSH